MHVHIFRTIMRCSVAVTLLVTALVLDAGPAAAQMQIPNPLIRPRSLTSGNNPTNPPNDTAANAQRAPAPQPAFSSAAVLGAPATHNEDPYMRDLADLRDRLAPFYVSAIVGRKAILRRSAAAQRSGSTQTTSQPTGSSMAPLPLNSGSSNQSSNQSSRNDSITVSDGELLEAVSNTGTLITKIANGRVVIYHIQELGNLPGGRLAGRRAIVFAGDVENSGTPLAAAIVLERPDPAFKRFIAVDTKVRSASAAATDGATPSPAATAPQSQ